MLLLIVASAAVAAFLNNHGTLDSSPTPTPTATAPTPTATPKPSSTPNPTATSHPTPTQTTNQPQVTPAPTSMLPGDCKINYQEITNSYDAQANETRIVLAVQLIPDISTRNTYYLYPASFYLKENSAAITSPNTNDKSNPIMLQELDRIDISLTFTVKGQYTSKNYELAYTHLAPDFPSSLILVFKKIINTT